VCDATLCSWFDVCGTVMEFECAVATDQVNWGSMKSQYR
jgi:hypothetical protein